MPRRLIISSLSLSSAPFSISSLTSLPVVRRFIVRSISSIMLSADLISIRKSVLRVTLKTRLALSSAFGKSSSMNIFTTSSSSMNFSVPSVVGKCTNLFMPEGTGTSPIKLSPLLCLSRAAINSLFAASNGNGYLELSTLGVSTGTIWRLKYLRRYFFCALSISSIFNCCIPFS